MRSKTWLEVDGRFAIGEGGVALLAAIREYGSLAEAAKRVGWSYRHAWGYVRRAEMVLGHDLIETRSGKGKHRGTLLTQSGAVLARGLDQFTKTTGVRRR